MVNMFYSDGLSCGNFKKLGNLSAQKGVAWKGNQMGISIYSIFFIWLIILFSSLKKAPGDPGAFLIGLTSSIALPIEEVCVLFLVCFLELLHKIS